MVDLTRQTYCLSVTTQGPLYPPSEVMDSQGNFVVIGLIPSGNKLIWGRAIVSSDSNLPQLGCIAPYNILQDINNMTRKMQSDVILYTLPLPIPMNNYGMTFAPEQRPQANTETRNSIPLNEGYIADFRVADGKREVAPITLADWLDGEGWLDVQLIDDKKRAKFSFTFTKLVPNSVYTVMSLRENDLAQENPTRPGPLGIPNSFITDSQGNADFWAELPNPFPDHSLNGNRVINVVVLYMSSRQTYGGAIGIYGLGGDIHAHLKLKSRSFDEFLTVN
ncbi:hypothetical protein [Photobacterium carnosum]|uniref:hypothetical protein n=1 Tax=Photobacterium carnosum TaxID=2023717 RepID=UPI001E5FB7A4|nr:hypothetical protein [Photobacterium carnosum]MCD9496571.1 hypothetical protein [Photobacterium carnosum]